MKKEQGKDIWLFGGAGLTADVNIVNQKNNPQ